MIPPVFYSSSGNGRELPYHNGSLISGYHNWLAGWSGQGELQAFTQRPGGAVEGLERDRLIGRVEQAVEGSAAGVHAARHLGLGQVLFFHQLLDLIGDDTLDRHRFGFCKQAFFGQKIIEAGTKMFVFHHSSRNGWELPYGNYLKCIIFDTLLSIQAVQPISSRIIPTP